MDLQTFAELVAKTREAQKKFFRMKGVAPELKSEQLNKSRELERKVDKAIDSILKPQLF